MPHDTASNKAPPVAGAPLRVLFALPGLHKVVRGAEVAFESVARELARLDGFDVTLAGSGDERPGEPYRFISVRSRPRERFEGWPRLPIFRNDCSYEEATFAPGLWRAFDPLDYDATIACSYPFCNWVLRGRRTRGRGPAHVFVTQNGDWPATYPHREYRYFGCDALVCINPVYMDRNKERWNCALIPNGVDPATYRPGPGARERFGFPASGPVVLIVSALIRSKRVIEGIEAAARVPGVFVAVAGNGPIRDEVDQAGARLLGDRYRRLTVPREQMPELYRSADAFLHMSLDEPFGNVYIEALASGLPVVAHDTRVTRWMMGDMASLVDTINAGAVADAIRAALARRDQAAAAHAAAAVVERFGWPVIAAQYAALLRQVAGRSQASAPGQPPGVVAAHT